MGVLEGVALVLAVILVMSADVFEWRAHRTVLLFAVSLLVWAHIAASLGWV